MIFLALLAVVCAYLIGSINFAVIFTKAFTKKDVRNFGSGNAGSTNALRVGGKLNGALTFICDFLKGVLASAVGKVIFSYINNAEPATWSKPVYGMLVCGLLCMIGHIYPLFFEFKGGKGVATGAGIFMFICPVSSAIGLAVFAVTAFLTRYVSVASFVATVSVITVFNILYDNTASYYPQLVISIIIGIIIFVRHKDNIARLIKGTENKLGGNKNV